MKFIFASLACTIAITGCSKTAGCNDSETKKTVERIVTQQVQKARWGEEMFEKGYLDGFKVEDVVTAYHDSKMDKYTCEANVSFSYRDKHKKVPIKYETSYLEDKKETDVGVYGVEKVKTQVMVLGMGGQ